MKNKNVLPEWGDLDRLKKSYEDWKKTDNFQDCLDLLAELAKE